MNGNGSMGMSVDEIDLGAMAPEEARSFLLGCFDKLTTASRLYVMGVALACSTQMPAPAPAHTPKPVRLRLVANTGSGFGR